MTTSNDFLLSVLWRTLALLAVAIIMYNYGYSVAKSELPHGLIVHVNGKGQVTRIQNTTPFMITNLDFNTFSRKKQ